MSERRGWFVMFYCRSDGFPEPLMDEEDRIALFSSEEAADAAAEDHPLSIYGWETYEWT